MRGEIIVAGTTPTEIVGGNAGSSAKGIALMIALVGGCGLIGHSLGGKEHGKLGAVVGGALGAATFPVAGIMLWGI